VPTHARTHTHTYTYMHTRTQRHNQLSGYFTDFQAHRRKLLMFQRSSKKQEEMDGATNVVITIAKFNFWRVLWSR